MASQTAKKAESSYRTEVRDVMGNDVLSGPARRETRMAGKPAPYTITKRHDEKRTTTFIR